MIHYFGGFAALGEKWLGALGEFFDYEIMEMNKQKNIEITSPTIINNY